MGVSPLTKSFSSIVYAIQYNCHVRRFGTSCFHRHVSSRFWNELYNSTKYKVGVLYYLGGLNSDRTVLPSWRDLSQGLLRGIGCVATSLRDYLRRGFLCLLAPISDHLLIYTIFQLCHCNVVIFRILTNLGFKFECTHFYVSQVRKLLDNV